MKSKLDALVNEHGTIGDERLILMAALTVTDELFDARADVDELLSGSSGENTSLISRLADADTSSGDEEPPRLRAKG